MSSYYTSHIFPFYCDIINTFLTTQSIMFWYSTMCTNAGIEFKTARNNYVQRQILSWWGSLCNDQLTLVFRFLWGFIIVYSTVQYLLSLTKKWDNFFAILLFYDISHKFILLYLRICFEIILRVWKVFF